MAAVAAGSRALTCEAAGSGAPMCVTGCEPDRPARRSRNLLRRMTKPRHPPVPDDPARLPPGGRRTGASHPVRAALVALAAVILGTALLGAAAGWLWATLAPRALAVVAGRGSANVVNPETGAFIAADAWFTLLTAGGGVISGLLGYALAVRRHGALAMTGILAGGLAATLIAMWIGQRSG